MNWTAKAHACRSLRKLCQAAAPSIAAAQALAPLMAELEKAIASVGLEQGERLAIIQGLAAVAAALPVDEAGEVFSRLTSSAAFSLRTLSTTQVCELRRVNGFDAPVVVLCIYRLAKEYDLCAADYSFGLATRYGHPPLGRRWLQRLGYSPLS